MKKILYSIVLFALTFNLMACTTDQTPSNESDNPGQQEEQGDQKGDNEKVDEEPADNWDAQIEESIEIEGMEEPITLNLYDKGIAPFKTYIPSDFVAEEASSGEGDAYWFYANYQGQKVDDIYLQLYFFSKDIKEEPSIDDKDSTYATILKGMEMVDPSAKQYDWAIKEFTDPSQSDHAMLGEHEGQYFLMVLNSSVEYSEGFYPRANKIIEHFYWTDTKEYLAR